MYHRWQRHGLIFQALGGKLKMTLGLFSMRQSSRDMTLLYFTRLVYKHPAHALCFLWMCCLLCGWWFYETSVGVSNVWGNREGLGTFSLSKTETQQHMYSSLMAEARNLSLCSLNGCVCVHTSFTENILTAEVVVYFRESFGLWVLHWDQRRHFWWKCVFHFREINFHVDFFPPHSIHLCPNQSLWFYNHWISPYEQDNIRGLFPPHWVVPCSDSIKYVWIWLKSLHWVLPQSKGLGR